MRMILLVTLALAVRSQSANAAWPADPNMNVQLSANLCIAQDPVIVGDGIGRRPLGPESSFGAHRGAIA